jgi:transposase
MDDHKLLLRRLAALEREVDGLRHTAVKQDDRIKELVQTIAERDARIAELEEELRRRDKNYRPKPNTPPRQKSTDRRRKGHRRHGGVFRPRPKPAEVTHHHDVYPESCPKCCGDNLKPTGEFDDHIQVDIPEPKTEVHRFRRHEMCCQDCHSVCQGRGDLELPGSHIGPRARLLAAYARAHLGISLGKTAALFAEWFGVHESRAGVLGHVKWAGNLCAPVVQKLLEILRQSPVVFADETGWRINGKNVWAWCFGNPQLAVYLIDQRRNRAVLTRTLGDSLPGVLVSDFYAVYDGIDCLKQRCLPHLLRELHRLREALSARSVSYFIQPVITLLKDAIELGKQRDRLSVAAFAAARQTMHDRLDVLILEKNPTNRDCLRIWNRLFKHCGELFTFLGNAAVPSDNSACERDIRSVAAARGDGGVNRTDWGATAFGNIKSVVRTCQKQAKSFVEYGIELVRSMLNGSALPLPFPNTS